MTRKTDNREFSRLIHRAYIRDDAGLHMGEALLIACLLHAKGGGRDSEDMKQVRQIMKDHNLDKKD